MPAPALPPHLTRLPPTTAVYLPVLTGVRALAAYLVYVFHYNPFWEGDGLAGLPQKIVQELHVGVPIFFVLSGFLITLRYAKTDFRVWASWGPYVRNRLARIYPMYFLLTALTFASLWYQTGEFSWKLWLMNITFLRSFFQNFIFSGIPQGWTLTVEECFYLTAPLFFLILRQRPQQLWLLPGLLMVSGCALVVVGKWLAFYGLFANLRFMLLFTFFGRATEFFVGIQLARWFRQRQLTAHRSGGILTVAGVLGIVALVLVLGWIRGPYIYGQHHPVGIVLNNLVLPVCVAVWFVGLLTERTRLQQLLSSRIMQMFGRCSYVFYLIHVGVVRDLITGLFTTQPLLVFLLLNVAAIGLHYLVEEPLNRWIRTFRLPQWRTVA